MLQNFTYEQRIDALRAAKIQANLEKQSITGSLNSDDLAFILPPENRRKVVHAISGSGVEITDVIMTGVEVKSNHPNGGFYGAKACGENFGILLKSHPTYVDPMSSLAGAYMTNFRSFQIIHTCTPIRRSTSLSLVLARPNISARIILSAWNWVGVTSWTKFVIAGKSMHLLLRIFAWFLVVYASQ